MVSMTTTIDTGKKGLVKSANLHIDGRCNYRCKHCIAQDLVHKNVKPEKWAPVLSYLKSEGITKVNIVGGEPMMYPHIYELCEQVHSMGFTTSIVTNGSLLNDEKLKKLSESVDWIGLSIDSPDEQDEIALGRHKKGLNHIEHVVEIADAAHELGMKVKLNITVIKSSWNKDFRPLIERIGAERVKVFRALAVDGVNSKNAEEWLITDEQFKTMRELHEGMKNIVFEDNSEMISSYLMFDPLARCRLNDGKGVPFIPFEELQRRGIDDVVDTEGYEKRKGNYNWGSA